MRWIRRLRDPQRIFARPEDPYMTRWFLPWNYRLHVFYRGDQDRDPHDHPYDFDTFPLRGYWEEVWSREDSGIWDFELRYVKPFRWHRRKAEHTHRVLDPVKDHWIFGRKIVTLVKGYPVRRKWGFWIRPNGGPARGRRCWVPWREYLGAPADQEMSTGHKVGD